MIDQKPRGNSKIHTEEDNTLIEQGCLGNGKGNCTENRGKGITIKRGPVPKCNNPINLNKITTQIQFIRARVKLFIQTTKTHTDMVHSIKIPPIITGK